MMKNLLMIVAFAVAFAACKKEEMVSPALSDQEAEVIDNAIDEVFITEAEEQVDWEFLNSEILGGSEDEDFYMENDGLHESYLIETGDIDMMGKRQWKLVRCLISVKPSEEQIAKLRRVFASYDDCKKDAVQNYRKDFLMLHRKVQAARKDLVQAYRNNRIDKRQFFTAMKNLRKRYSNEVTTIKRKYARTLRSCHGQFLRNINRVLTERQWKAFTNCLKSDWRSKDRNKDQDRDNDKDKDKDEKERDKDRDKDKDKDEKDRDKDDDKKERGKGRRG